MTKYPEAYSDPKVENFLTSFYKVSDTVGADAAYVNQFYKDAKLTMGLKVADGFDRELFYLFWIIDMLKFP